MKMTDQTKERDATIPEHITIEVKKGTSRRRRTGKKNAAKSTQDGSERRASLPLGFDTTDKEPDSTRRRSTMPQVTQEMRDSLPPLHELAALLMPPANTSMPIRTTSMHDSEHDSDKELKQADLSLAMGRITFNKQYNGVPP